MPDRSLVWLLAALSTSCAAATGEAPIELVFDPCGLRVAVASDARAPERASVDAALTAWNEAAGLALSRADASAPGAVTIRFEPSIPAFFGVYDDTDGSITINRTIDDDRRRTVVIMHELGHAFGLTHVPREIEASLMNPGNTTVAPTDGDVERLRALWGRCDAPTNPD
ncbi:MAG TPA: hypothetical protein VIL20_08685 [Sandaracinaceae bacterium]